MPSSISLLSPTTGAVCSAIASLDPWISTSLGDKAASPAMPIHRVQLPSATSENSLLMLALQLDPSENDPFFREVQSETILTTTTASSTMILAAEATETGEVEKEPSDETNPLDGKQHNLIGRP